MKEFIYALYYEYAEERHYFYVGHTTDPKRRLTAHRSAVRNLRHQEDVYKFIREQCEPNGIPIWAMEVLVTEETARPEDNEDFWVVLMIRAGHELKNMRHGDLHRITLRMMAHKRPDLDFKTVDEYIEFRETVEREDQEAYARSEHLRREILGEVPGDPQLLAMIQQNAERHRETSAERARRAQRREARAQLRAQEHEEWLRQMRLIARRTDRDEENG